MQRTGSESPESVPDVLNNELTVDGIRQRLPHLGVVQRLLARVDFKLNDRIDDLIALGGHYDVRKSLYPCYINVRHRTERTVMNLALLDRGNSSGGVTNEAHHDSVKIG